MRMISVEEALAHVTEQQTDFGTETVDILSSVGRIIAQHVMADRDFPPFNRATMDGIAISTAAFVSGVRSYPIESIQPAGHPRKTLTSISNCLEIMTGAMLPVNADAVVRYEDVTINENTAHVNITQVTPYQHVHLRGTDQKQGEVLVLPGTLITPAVTAVIASVGLSEIKVRRLPKIAVCATGDELVAISQHPQPHQIRQSNNYMLLAALRQEGILADNYHLPDDENNMTAQLATLVPQYDAILFSGAVSKGKYDFLPAVLQKSGMKTIFHSVAQKPGKPFLFGKFANGPLVFGFPGNPVSTWVCYQLYFGTWLHASLGANTRIVTVELASTINFKPPLTNHLLVKLQNDVGQLKAIPVNTSTSGDMVNLMQAEGIISLPADREVFKSGEKFKARLFKDTYPADL